MTISAISARLLRVIIIVRGTGAARRDGVTAVLSLHYSCRGLHPKFEGFPEDVTAVAAAAAAGNFTVEQPRQPSPYESRCKVH